MRPHAHLLRRRRARLVAALLGLSLLGGCAETETASDAGKPHPANDAGEPGPGDLVLNERGSSGTTTPGPTGADGAAPSTGSGGQGLPGGSADDPAVSAPNYLQARYATIGFGETTPRGCTLKRGEQCRMRFDGFYRMTTAASGRIMIASYENDSASPASKTELPVVKGGSQWYVDRFLYPVGQDARFVTFRVVLVDGNGRELAAAPPSRADISTA